MIYSIAETAKANALKPFEYFEHILTSLSQHPQTDIDTLVPWSGQLPESCRLGQEQSEDDLTDLAEPS